MSGAPDPDRAASDALIWRGRGLARLVEIMARLRAPDGCAWDRAQDFASIAPYTLEEAAEVADAIARGAMVDLRDELGDLALQVVYHAQMATEAGLFSLDEVLDGASAKMLRRHPHVFGPEEGAPPADPDDWDWEGIKAAERAARGERRDSLLDGIPPALPALARALKLTQRAAQVGFDWTDPRDVLAKLGEEVAELTAEIGRADQAAMLDEFGDVLFVLANLGRHLGVDPEAALRHANAKFDRRFRAVEAALAAQGRSPAEATLDEMEALWREAKARETPRQP